MYQSRGVITILSRRETGFHSHANLVEQSFFKRTLNVQTGQVKSFSQLVNLPIVRPLMKLKLQDS